MNYLKSLSALGTALVLMALASSASATSLTSPTGTTYTGTFTAVAHGTLTLTGSFVTVDCKAGHTEGKVIAHGSSTTVKIELKTHSLAECNFPVTINKPGFLEIHAVENDFSGDDEHTGTVTSTGTEMTIQTSVGSCIFTTSSTDVGLLTGTDDTKGHATIDQQSHTFPRTGGSAGFLCGSSGTANGGYTVTVPTSLWVDQPTI